MAFMDLQVDKFKFKLQQASDTLELQKFKNKQIRDIMIKNRTEKRLKSLGNFSSMESKGQQDLAIRHLGELIETKNLS